MRRNLKPSRVLFAPLLTLVMILLLLSACSDGGYYLQAVKGQYAILSQRQPIAQLLEDDQLDEKKRTDLARILEIRDFASSALALPDNDSYRSYVELHRPYPVWNLVAAPALSLQAKTWCFPIAGCVAYRGYFSEADAQDLARELRQQGYDTLVTGVPAYSTLNWFDDPVLSSFSHWPAPSVARLIFHELAHQQLYLPGDSAFNEAFATSVEIAGATLWLAQQGTQEERNQFQIQLKREATFVDWTNGLHRQLAELYASAIPAEEKLAAKSRIFAAAQEQYLSLKQSWGGYRGYDNWVKTLNNARLASLQTYRRLLPAFENLLSQNHNDFALYYRACKKLAEEPPDQRDHTLAELAQRPTLAERKRP
jgi:predicted aminopeptidase